MTKTLETSKTKKETETPTPEDEEFRIREHWNGRTIYLLNEVIDALDLLSTDRGRKRLKRLFESR